MHLNHVLKCRFQIPLQSYASESLEAGPRNLNLRRLFKFSDVCGPRKSEILGKDMHERHPANFIAILD